MTNDKWKWIEEMDREEWEDSEELLNVRETAVLLKVNPSQIYRLAKMKRIPGTKITGKWIFPKRELIQWIVEHAQEWVGR